jgi:hypothetical protein
MHASWWANCFCFHFTATALICSITGDWHLVDDRWARTSQTFNRVKNYFVCDVLNEAYQEAAHQGAAHKGFYDLKPI